MLVSEESKLAQKRAANAARFVGEHKLDKEKPT
jgi:hypothetical protein